VYQGGSVHQGGGVYQGGGVVCSVDTMRGVQGVGLDVVHGHVVTVHAVGGLRVEGGEAGVWPTGH